MAVTRKSKRRRRFTCVSRRTITPSPGSIHIKDLPDAILGGVSAYLPKPSRALFAVAMTAPSSSWAKSELERQTSATSKAILSPSSALTDNQSVADQTRNSERWETLDFVGIDTSLSSRLTDDDVRAILVCINANKRMKVLKLTGCVNITGHGLEPLRGSIVLEQIDLSLAAQHESPAIDPEPSISEAVALPILDSIVGADGSSLKHIQLPHAWREKQSPLVAEFLERYNVLLGNHRSSCSKCDFLLPDRTIHLHFSRRNVVRGAM
ncbi:hypothetical protein ACHAXR_004271 [Thalassiosira sp. AJA248-18]